MDPWFVEHTHFRMNTPKLFGSVERGGWFTECVDCGRDLRPHGTYYLVEKAFRGSETVYEYALCLGCREELETKISDESRGQIEQFFQSNVLGFVSRGIRIARATSRRDDQGAHEEPASHEDQTPPDDPARHDDPDPRDDREAPNDRGPGEGRDSHDDPTRRVVPEDEVDSHLAPWIDRCLIRSTPMEDCRERVLVGVCDGPDLLVGSMPWMLSGDALESMQEILSKSTQDELGGWKDEHLGTPPEFEELLKGPRIVVF